VVDGKLDKSCTDVYVVAEKFISHCHLHHHHHHHHYHHSVVQEEPVRCKWRYKDNKDDPCIGQYMVG